MALSDTYLRQLNDLNTRMGQMTPVDPNEVTRDFSARVGNFAPQYAELGGLTSQAMQTPISLMQQYQQQFGGTAGPSAMNRLGDITAQVGNIYGTRQALGNAIGQAGGNLKDLANQAYGLYNSQREGLQQQYGNLMPLYQQAAQQEEANRSRAAQADLARLYAGGGSQSDLNEQKVQIPAGGIFRGQRYPNGATLIGADAQEYLTKEKTKSESLQKGVQLGNQVKSIGNNMNPMSMLFPSQDSIGATFFGNKPYIGQR